MILRPDLVLVALPPREETRRSSGLIVLAPHPDLAVTTGLVRLVGDAVANVAPGDHVLFGGLVGLPLDIAGWPHLLLREVDLDAVIEGTP